MKNYRKNKTHANYAEEVDVVVKWLKEFKDGQVSQNKKVGLCTASSLECASTLIAVHSGDMYGLFPIDDTESALSPADQYSCLHKYKGRQLELRVEYAEYLIDYFNESIRI